MSRTLHSGGAGRLELTPVIKSPLILHKLPTVADAWTKRSKIVTSGVPRIEAALEHVLNCRVQHGGYNPFFDRSVCLTTKDGIGFIGCAREHGNPPESGSAVRAAIAAMVASGYTAGIHGVFVRDRFASRSQLLSPSDLGTIGRFVGHNDSLFVTEVGTSLTEGKILTGCQCHGVLRDGKTSALVSNPRQKRSPILWKGNRAWSTDRPDDEMIFKIINQLLKRILKNSTADGKTRPAKKRHAAAAVKAREIVLAVNVRDPEWPDEVRCSEMGLAAICSSLGQGAERESWDSWPLTIIYSPDYVRTDGSLGLPCVCPACLGILGQHTVHGKMMLVVSNGIKIEFHQLSDLLPRCYASNEAGLLRGQNPS